LITNASRLLACLTLAKRLAGLLWYECTVSKSHKHVQRQKYFSSERGTGAVTIWD